MHLVRPLPLDARPLPAGVGVRPLVAADLDEVACLYFDAYAAGVAAETLEEARTEMADVLAGAFGTPIPAATLVAEEGGRIEGCIQTVLDPPWDAPDGPFVIELFVHPDHRRRGLGTEPMTCPPNAFATGEDVIRLEPGASFTSSWGVTLNT